MGVNYTQMQRKTTEVFVWFLFTSGFTMKDSSPLACALHLVFIGLKELGAYWLSIRFLSIYCGQSSSKLTPFTNMRPTVAPRAFALVLERKLDRVSRN